MGDVNTIYFADTLEIEDVQSIFQNMLSRLARDIDGAGNCEPVSVYQLLNNVVSDAKRQILVKIDEEFAEMILHGVME